MKNGKREEFDRGWTMIYTNGMRGIKKLKLTIVNGERERFTTIREEGRI